LFGIKRHDCCYGSEDFFLAHAHVVVGFSQHGGFEEVARQSNIRALAAVTQGRAFIHADTDIGFNLFQLGLESQWAKLSLILERVADDDGGGALSYAFYQLVVHAAVREDAAAGNAGLTCGGEDTSDDTDCRISNIGIFENDVGALASELEGRADKA